MTFHIPWVVLLAVGLHREQPYIREPYATIVVLLYALTMAVMWVITHEEEWKRKLHVTQTEHRLVYVKVCEFAVVLLSAYASVYLLVATMIPSTVFWVCLALGTLGQYGRQHMWQREELKRNLCEGV
jgi:Ca2+/Na+ antiporter